MRRWLLLLGLVFAVTAQAGVKAQLDNTQAAVGEPVRLTLRYDGQTREQPDLAPLAADFEVLSTSRSNNVQFINGTVTAHTDVQVILAPKQAGQLVVPALTWGSERSEPLTLNVVAGAKPGGAKGDTAPAENVFVETLIDQKDPYVQAAVNITVRVYAAESLYQASLEFAGNSDVLVQQVGTDRNRSMEKNGRQFDVVERHYVLFPQKSGDLKLPGAILAGQVAVRLRPDRFTNDPFADLLGAAGGLTGGVRPIRVHGEDIVLHVRERPAGVDARYWLPARAVTLTGKWHPENLEAHVGDPLNLELHLRAEGLSAAQLPDLSALWPMPPGLKAYPDQAKLDNVVQGETVIGSRDQSIAVIAERPGSFVLAPLRVTWWDTATNQMRETTLPGRTLTILPAVGAPALPSASAAANSVPDAAPAAGGGGAVQAIKGLGSAGAWKAPSPWKWVALALGVLWLLTLTAWWASRRTPKPRVASPRAARPRTAAELRDAYQQACRRNDAPGTRDALLAWAALVWPEEPPVGLAALARQIGDEAISARLLELDRALYGGGSWNGAALQGCLSELVAKPPDKDGDDDGLAPLYR